jgi:predicted phage terminase large subunit-like protein
VLERGGYHQLILPAEHEPSVTIDMGACSAGIAHEPVRQTEGELLWPAQFNAHALALLKRDLGPYAAAGQLQQRPTPRVGAVLDPGLFKPLPVGFSREGLTVCQFWDTAFSEKKSADHTAAVTLATNPAEQMFITHLFSERLDGVADPADPDRPTRLDLAMVEHIVATRPNLIGVEKAAFKQKAIEDMIRRVQRLLRARGISVSIKPIEVDGDKVTRAQIVAGRAQAGDIHADKTHPLWTAYSAQLSAFPMRTEDDFVDATSGVVTMAVEHVALLSRSRELAALAGTTLPIHRDRPGDGWGRLDPKIEGLFGR